MQVGVNGFSMRVLIEGRESAPAIVLHHALAADLSSFDEVAAALRPCFRVIRFDARGHGQSEATPAAYSLPQLACDVVALLDHLGIERAHFLGVSMGGMIGQQLALDHGPRVASLCLVSTTSCIPAEAQSMWQSRIAAVRNGGMATQADAAIARWLSPAAQSTRPDLVARLRASILATPVEGFVGWCEAIRALDTTARLRTITCPTLIIAGALDPGTPVAAAEAIHQAITGATLAVLPSVSHMLHLEAADRFTELVATFLDARETS